METRVSQPWERASAARYLNCVDEEMAVVGI